MQRALGDTPVGDLTVVAEAGSITGVYMQLPVRQPPGSGDDHCAKRTDDADSPLLGEALRQLHEYFVGRRRVFDLPLAPAGTPFQRSVWAGLATIGYGETLSYASLAARVGRPGAARAVGAASGRNPISVILPCHRVIGADGSLTGYAGGLPRKRVLLDLEARHLIDSRPGPSLLRRGW